jgi:hypothetical protein
MPYFNNITGAIEQGARTSDLWSLLSGLASEGFPEFAGATIFDMNYVAGQARGIISAQNNFASQAPTDVVESGSWTWAPWAQPTESAFGMPQYQLRYRYSAQDAEGSPLLDPEGNPLQVWGVTDWSGSLDTTAQTITDRAFSSAQASLDTGSPGAKNQIGDLAGVSPLDITAVQILRF